MQALNGSQERQSLNRRHYLAGIDTYGTGRSPFFLEPSVIIIITDGGKLTSQQGVQDDVSTKL